MANEKQDRLIPPPYLPYRTFRGYVEGLKEAGIPAKIDRSVLRNRSGTEQTMLLNALQYLGLITNDGTPTPALTQLVAADGEEHQKVLRDLLTMRYMFLFADGFNLENATPAMVQDAFRNAGVTGDTIRKAMAFFLAAAQEAQIPLSSYLKVRPGRPVGSQRRRGRPGQERQDEGANGDEESQVGSPSPGTVRFSLPLPGKPPIQISVAENLTVEDWAMVDTMVRAYIERRKKA